MKGDNRNEIIQKTSEDIERSTEGSGLGLSIARDLAKLMNAKFELYLDGDLFRVTITFARIND